MLSAALWAASGAAVLMLSSSGQFGSFGSSTAAGNLRHSRRLAAAAASSSDAPRGSSSRRLATVNEVDPAIVQTVQKLAEPFLADESTIFAFDETDPRPVVNTFFAIPEGRQISQIDAETLAVWKQAWSGAGWNPVSSIDCSLGALRWFLHSFVHVFISFVHGVETITTASHILYSHYRPLSSIQYGCSAS